MGIDLAAGEAKTAIAEIRWGPGHATVEGLRVGASDEVLLAGIARADKAGIDCPLGWPEPFIEFLAAHRAGQLTAPEDVGGQRWRRRLAYRSTDEVIRARTGLVPLSVAADRIGHTAMRCAGLLAILARTGRPVDRLGAGVVVEVYPAAALKAWGLPWRGYKGPAKADVLGHLVDALAVTAPWLLLGGFEPVCRRTDHAVDAVIAALVARAAATDRTAQPEGEQAALAGVEGWIALPTTPLEQLCP